MQGGAVAMSTRVGWLVQGAYRRGVRPDMVKSAGVCTELGRMSRGNARDRFE